ncbi:MAG: LON peptidase substrate-binding domain-containing protein [Hyphomicrobiales bacterium]|nr:LON peptidase substrate-binding domain-containing protein [Hyphomicrobiales bacterium]
MQVGNAHYNKATDLPQQIAMFPLSAALLLPDGRMPLNIFEPRYLEMIDNIISGSRIIGMIQPRLDGAVREDGEPELCDVGCCGRITSLSESGDGRYLITLQGICRFRIARELIVKTPYRQCQINPFVTDLNVTAGEEEVDRKQLWRTFRDYLEANGMEADWDNVSQAENGTLVNALSMMSPYGPAEKQALLEAPDLKTRAETLVAITEIALARDNNVSSSGLQ